MNFILSISVGVVKLTGPAGTGKTRLLQQLEAELQSERQETLLFLTPPTWDELVRRLSGRGTEPPEVVARRLEVAQEELAAEGEFDVTLVNTSVQDVVDSLIALTRPS
jgi:guanylate kinase